MPESDNSLVDFRDLLERVFGGSEEAARELVERFGDSLRRAVRRCLDRRRRLRSVFDSQDFEQMVWCSFFRRREDVPRFDRPEELVAFLVGMAKKKIACVARNRLVRPQHNLNRERSLMESIHEASDIPDGGTATIESLVEREQLENHLGTLPGPQRQMVELWLQGRRKTEIAERLGIPERTFRRVWKKLLLLLRTLFTKEAE